MRLHEIIPLAEAKIFQARQHPGAHEQLIYQNPTLSDLRGLLEKSDFRGIMDDKNLYVWDASKLIHYGAACAIALAGMWKGDALEPLYQGDRPTPKYNAARDCMYFFNPTIGENADREEWVDNFSLARGVKVIPLCEGVTMSCHGAAMIKGETIPAMARLIRRASPQGD